jgi:hypothetical protein
MRTRLAGIAVVALFAVVSTASAATWVVLRTGGVSVKAPAGWSLVPAAATDADAATDPRTVLVAGTEGATPRRSECQVAAYRVPSDGAVVVALRWPGKAPDWLPAEEGLADLRLRREYFACFDGRGASAQIALRGRAYQVNVMVGDKATARTIATALAVARSFDAAR